MDILTTSRYYRQGSLRGSSDSSAYPPSNSQGYHLPIKSKYGAIINAKPTNFEPTVGFKNTQTPRSMADIIAQQSLAKVQKQIADVSASTRKLTAATPYIIANTGQYRQISDIIPLRPLPNNYQGRQTLESNQQMKQTTDMASIKRQSLPNVISQRQVPNDVRKSSLPLELHSTAMPSRPAGAGTKREDSQSEEYCLKLFQEIVSNFAPVEYYASSPAKLLDYLYIGGYRDAEDLVKLRRLGITHVFNCAPMRANGQSPYPPNCGVVAYDQVSANDEESYDILQHYERARQFVDRAKFGHGRCLVHCAMGVNRSGALCAAYIIADQRMKLLDVVRLMKQRRGIVLCNRGFQRQLVKFAKQRGLL